MTVEKVNPNETAKEYCERTYPETCSEFKTICVFRILLYLYIHRVELV